MRELNPDEDAEVTKLMNDHRVETSLLLVGYRAGIYAGLRRALLCVRRDPTQQAAAVAITNEIQA
jgi:hypothetical protein